MNDWKSLLKRSHSGDTLTAISMNGETFIRKIFLKPDARVLASIKKQKTFKSLNAGEIIISSVDILDYLEENSTVSLLMPYIDGISGVDLATWGDSELGKILSISINNLIISEFNTAKNLLIKTNIFQEKLNEISSKLNNKKIISLGNKIKSDLLKMGSEIEIPMGQCHGDLTLSNVICSRYQGVKLIDFLSVFLESPLQDVSKVIQEYRYSWSFRYLPPSLKRKGEIFLTANTPDIISLISKKYSLQVKIMTQLTLYRIAPYLKDKITEDWLIYSLNNYIEEND